MQRIVYFTEGPVASEAEETEIAEIASVIEKQFELAVFNGAANANYGAGQAAADYVAGTVPAGYSDEETYPVFDPASPPFVLPATNAIVVDGDEFAVTGGTVSVAVEDNVATFTFTAA